MSISFLPLHTDTAYQCGIPWCRGCAAGRASAPLERLRHSREPRTGGTLPTFPLLQGLLLLDRTAATGKEKRKGERRG